MKLVCATCYCLNAKRLQIAKMIKSTICGISTLVLSSSDHRGLYLNFPFGYSVENQDKLSKEDSRCCTNVTINKSSFRCIS